ncbi:MAG: formate--phosphoribosylaminoimidazolecarboxamide ligase [Candidatus Roizmanbacteria bacterium]|nr:MAG: formate--phosphoribosylaminoimidazolecarboxamide ligase [Candidatus Roizmanbacteria bacterium]
MVRQSYTIATLGSHSALQILKGAHDEGFNTLLITTPNRIHFYEQFPFIKKIISVPNFFDYKIIENKIKDKKTFLIPHGSFNAYLSVEGNKKIKIPYFGNKQVLEWETDRQKQRNWLKEADINLPRQFADVEDIYYPVIVKSYGAAGGKGYFYAKNRKDFENKMKKFGTDQFVIQEYIIGNTFYIHYFYSPLTKKLEIMSMDRRYESNVDSLGRIPLTGQEGLKIEPSYVVVGNSPLSLRESLLPEAFAMGERVVATSQKIMKGGGLYGPFCLETVITPDQKFYSIEISCRIVAGTNLFLNGSPYSWLIYDEPMSTGRRIAREIKQAINQNKLSMIID